MQSFLSKVASEVLQGDHPLSEITFVLPNKRSGLFLKNILKEQLQVTTMLPQIVSIEDFIKGIAGFEILDSVSLLFEFYGIYKNKTPQAETDRFENFSKWAHILLQDFNDLDSNLFDTTSILSYLSDVKRIEHWDPAKSNDSHLVKNYLSFFDKIIEYHDSFKNHLLQKKAGYQGLVYRIASESLSTFKKENHNTKFVFAAFNALSKAEENIIQDLLLNGLAEIYWDHDEFYSSSNNQSEQFFKKYQKIWPYYASNEFLWKENGFNSPKAIHFHGLPKNVSQIKHAGALLKDLRVNKDIQDAAVILGNEKLLPALLNSLPPEIAKANITMGYELQNVSLNTLFQSLFKLHINRIKRKKDSSYYYKDLSALLNDPFLQAYFMQYPEIKKGLRGILFSEKTIYVHEDQIMALVSNLEEVEVLFQLMFLGWDEAIDLIIDNIISLIETLKDAKDLKSLNQEYLFRYYTIFVQLSNLNKNFGFIEDVETLYQVFQQLLKTEKLSFQGEPLEGLQIMGLLESRGLDFKNIIITSVNEGFLPASGSNNSFIPLDMKIEKKIPTFFEKDAIFSYHFFRLLHRAENVFLIYNNITDDFGSGEPSRFIRQLEVAKKLGLLDKVTFHKKTINPNLQISPLPLQSIEKTEPIRSILIDIGKNGFSPTSLITYIRNPLDFYKRSVLGLKEYQEVEETIAANTFGTIIHDTLENLYTPFLNQVLELHHIETMKGLYDDEVKKQFKKSYSSSSITNGKNYLAFEIAKQFVLNFLNYELGQLKKGNEIKIIGLEVPLKIKHQVRGLDFPIQLKGKIDRIDELNGVCRIMDYKTGKVSPNQLRLKEWELLITDEKYSKSFQVLTYAYMYLKDKKRSLDQFNLSTGIVSFKNLKDGFMSFNGESLSDSVMDSFLSELDKLVLEIFDNNNSFVEKELPVYNY